MENKLPEPYTDCVIKHEDGSVRIGRLDRTGKYWQLASYQYRTTPVVWGVENVTQWTVIDMEPEK